jgi:NDP-sugar pyrophosphorylase family protein
MEAIILVGGRGTRLKQVTKGLPKCMVEVKGKPFLERQIEWLRKSGVTHIILAVGDNYKTIEEHFGNGSKFGVEIDYSIEHEILGTAGALKYAMRLLNGFYFLCVHGDIAINAYLTDFITAFYRTAGIVAFMYCPKVDTDVKRYGRVIVDTFGRVRDFQEKGGNISPFINSGIVAMNKHILSYFYPGNGFEGLEDVYKRVTEEGRLYGYLSGADFVDIGTNADYKHYCELVELMERGKK